MILSTGSPLIGRNFRYVYDALTTDAQLVSISGGTDILSCFLLGCPDRPVCAGELTCRSPFPSVPLEFWNDHGGIKYREAYFAKYPGVRTQSDREQRRESGGFVVLGRSDTVLNPGGVRIGTAEIYRAIEDIAAISEADVVGFDTENGDVQVQLFVSLNRDAMLDERLRQGLSNAIRTRCTPRHVPGRISQVHDFPRTRAGKISESAVRSQVNGRPILNLNQFENPECLGDF
ncbi:hypothetical protein C1J03_24535 (plasmid) [Sulfitobacter sp. SK012]|nr:hypothetical protein C1J03_24535 [Sulfitobacter sp. SK012]